MSSGSIPATVGSGKRPVQFAVAQKMAVVPLSRPAQTPMVRGLTV